MAFAPGQPYNDLPLLPPAVDFETKAVLRKCIGANKALAELKGAGELIPNQAMLINAIPLQEAKLSSEIENIVTTNDKLFRAAAEEDGDIDPQTKEVLQYRTALRYGFDQLASRPLSVNMFHEICSIIIQSDASVRKIPGTTITNIESGETVYTPPVGEDVILDKLGNLEAFIHNHKDGLDPLIKMAIMHYQFEAIHPYHDGNGRTGRIINILYLVERGVLTLPVLYLSRYIIRNKPEYYRRLREVTEQGAWEEWILYLLCAIEQTAQWTRDRIHDIRDLFDRTVQKCRDELPKRAYSKELVEAIFVQPYCKIQFLVDSNIAKRQAASEYLRLLEEIGVLSSIKSGREKIYVNTDLVSVLSA